MALRPDLELAHRESITQSMALALIGGRDVNLDTLASALKRNEARRIYSEVLEQAIELSSLKTRRQLESLIAVPKGVICVRSLKPCDPGLLVDFIEAVREEDPGSCGGHVPDLLHNITSSECSGSGMWLNYYESYCLEAIIPSNCDVDIAKIGLLGRMGEIEKCETFYNEIIDDARCSEAEMTQIENMFQYRCSR